MHIRQIFLIIALFISAPSSVYAQDSVNKAIKILHKNVKNLPGNIQKLINCVRGDATCSNKDIENTRKIVGAVGASLAILALAATGKVLHAKGKWPFRRSPAATPQPIPTQPTPQPKPMSPVTESEKKFFNIFGSEPQPTGQPTEPVPTISDVPTVEQLQGEPSGLRKERKQALAGMQEIAAGEAMHRIQQRTPGQLTKEEQATWRQERGKQLLQEREQRDAVEKLKQEEEEKKAREFWEKQKQKQQETLRKAKQEQELQDIIQTQIEAEQEQTPSVQQKSWFGRLFSGGN